MAKQWTLDDLKLLSVRDRADLYKNACRLGHTPQGASLKRLCEEAGLPFSEDGCLTQDDPIYIKMHEIIYSKDGRDAAVAATKVGLPAMAGIDALLQVALGVDYGPHNMGTATAGGIVGELMHSLGYRKVGQRPLPANCVAKTAAMWE
jgi:hypothetical protein